MHHHSKHHPVFESQASQGVHGRYSDASREDAGTMVNFMWQADLHGVVDFVTDCLQLNASAGPVES